MRIKILYIITKSDIGGAQKYVNDLARHLDRDQFDAKILYGGKDLKWLSNKVRPLALFLNDWLAIFELVKILKKERPHVIHLNSSKAGIIGAIAAAIVNQQQRAHVIFTAHGWVFNPTNALSWPVRWSYILLHKLAARFQDQIICVSEYDYRLALHYGVAPEEKLTVIHNGIDPNIKFLSKEEARKEIMQKLEMGHERLGKAKSPPLISHLSSLLWIGSLGRLVKEKNYETFIHAAARMTEEQKNKETKEWPIFILIGSGSELEKLQLLIANYKLQNRFFIIQPTGNDSQYLKAFDMFVMTSIKEGLPYVLLEAMAAELPIVVTDAGGIPEMIKNHENGLMVTQKNPEMLARALQGLIENKNIARELAKNARHIVQTKFSLKEMIQRTESVYRENL
jgi:glycosyltransferase involved in cell wall biosynthesis